MLTHKNCLFLGQEVEGKERGIKTLFVSGRNHSLRSIQTKLLQNQIERVYFGAGNIFGLPAESLEETEKWSFLFKEYACCVEINSDVLFCEIPEQYIYYGLKIIWVVPTQRKQTMLGIPIISTVKLINSKENYLDCITTESSYINKLDDPLYLGDEKC